MIAETATPRPATSRGLLLGMTTGFLFLYIAWLLWGRSQLQERTLLGCLTLAFTGILSALAAQHAAHSQTGRASRGWLVLAIGIGLQTAGILALFLPLQGSSAFITAALRTTAVLFILVAVLLLPRQERKQSSRLRLLWDGLLATTAFLTLAWVALIQPQMPSPLVLQAFLPFVAPISDLVLLLLLLTLFIASDIEGPTQPFTGISLAIVLIAFSDLASVGLDWYTQPVPGSVIDLGWVAGSLLIFISILPTLTIDAYAPPVWLKQNLRRMQELLPLLSILLLGWYGLVDWQLHGQINALALWVTIILALGLIARQGVRAGEVEFEQYASLVNSIAEPAFICDSRGILRLVNPAMLRVTGFEQSIHLLGLPLEQVVELPPDLGSYNALRKMAGVSLETHLLGRSGSRIPVFLSLRPILPGGTERMALAGTVHDLSLQKSQQKALQDALSALGDANAALEALTGQLERKVVEKTASLSEALTRLEEQNLALRQLDTLKSDFVAMVSHELRAPLTNINAGIELLLVSGNPSREKREAMLNRVQAEIRRLTRYVETILDLSALDAGRMPLYPAPLSLPVLVEGLREQFENRPGAERIRWDVNENLPPVLADEQALLSVLFHLVDNALKYAPFGDIALIAGVEGERAFIRVLDSGPGIPEGALEMVFDRFYRYNSGDSQTVYGHGLGLYIVRRLMEAMGGTVEAANRPEGGACFQCWLPVILESEWEDDREDPSGG